MNTTAKNQMMSTTAAIQSTETALDGFLGYDDRIEGDDRPQGGGVIQGTIIKFTNEGNWITGDGDELSSKLELVAHDVARVVQKWIDQKREETIFVPPGHKFPDVDEMNAKAPKSEWRENLNNEMVGPWQTQTLLYLVDPQKLDRYTYPTSTVGGSIAIRELCNKVKWMRQHRGPNVSAVVTLSDEHMRTRFGGRQRPHFEVVRWIRPDGENALSPAKPRALEGSTAGLREVKEPSLKEDLADDLPDFCKR